MGLTENQQQGQEQDQRPRDWAYLARFDRKDLPSLEEMARHICETHNTDMIEDFNRKCEQKLRGDSATLDNGLEIKAVTKTGDLVVNAGLDQCIRIIQGTSSVRWSHFGFGVNQVIAAAVTDTALNTESAQRVSLAWAESVGMRLLFGGISSQIAGSRPDFAAEIGVYNGSAAGATLLNHSVLTVAPEQQQAGTGGEVSTAPIVVSAVIEFCPVA